MEISVYGIALLPVIIGIVQLLKVFGIPSKFLPLVSVGVGVLMSYIYVESGDLKKTFLIGLWLGICSTGMHSGFKNTMNGAMKKPKQIRKNHKNKPDNKN